MSYKPPARLEESPEKSVTAFGGGLGKENKQPVASGYKPHPRPEMAAAFRREVPTDFPRTTSKSRSPQKAKIGSGLFREDKFDTASLFGLKPKTR